MMTNGFVALSRSFLTSPVWKKPPYYIKLFLYLYLNAAYMDSEGVKRGEVIVNLNELSDLCSSGRGVNREVPSVKMIKKAIDYFCSEESGVNLRGTLEGKSLMRLTFVNYDKLSNSRQSRESVGGDSGDGGAKTTIIYNKINNINKKHVESRAEVKVKVKPTAFVNFEARDRDYNEIKRKAKERLRKK